MKIAPYKFILLFSCLAIFIGCNNDDNDNEPPRDFEIAIVGEFYDKVKLKWTESTDPENSIVTYDIYIKEDISGTSYQLVEGGLIDAQLNNNSSSRYIYSYTISDIADGKTWRIKIVATDQEGNSREVTTTALTKSIPEDPLPLGINSFSVPFSEYARREHTVTEFKGKLWLIGGQEKSNIYNDVWSSNDGVNWELVTEHAPFVERTQHCTFVFNNKLWVMGGYNSVYRDAGILNDIWVSEDGINWENVSNAPLPNPGYEVVVLNDKIWLFSENNNNPLERSFSVLFESSDGLTWVENTSFNLGAIYPQDVKIFKNKIWVANGGTKSITSLDPDTNSVESHIIPNEAANETHYFTRSNQELGVVRNRLVIICGYSRNGDSPLRDIWSSPDGVRWVLEKNLDQINAVICINRSRLKIKYLRMEDCLIPMVS